MDREKERAYYLSREHARGYDNRSLTEMSALRHREAAGTVGRFIPGGELLDIGCGPARMVIEVARLLPEVRITGIDVSEEMIRIGKENVEKAGFSSRITLHTLSAEGIGSLPGGSFDMVMTHGCFSGWIDPEASLDEILRILRPGGVLFVRDWNRAAPEGLAPYLEQARGNPEHMERVRTAFDSSYTDSELRKMLALDGLRPVEFSTEGIWMTAVLEKETGRKEPGGA